MAFDVGSVVAHIKADVTGFKAGIEQAQQDVESFKDKLGGIGKQLSLTGAALTLAAAPLAYFFKTASNEAIELEKNLTTLDIIAERFGVSGDKAKASAESLGRELRIGVGAAANGLQNLFKAGLNLDQATDLMKRFTNEAITGKSSSISLSQAVENLSFAYATNNSAIGNLSGINENFVNIIEKGREALLKEGVAANTITDEMAKYRGMIDLTNLTMGSSERFHGTLIDKQAQLGQKITDLKVSIGELINPYLTLWIDKLIQLSEWFISLDEKQQAAIITIGALFIAIGPLLTMLGLMASGVSALITVVGALGTALTFLAANPVVLIIAAIAAVIAIGWLLVANWETVKVKAYELVMWVKSLWESLHAKLLQIAGAIFDAMVSPFRRAWDEISKIVNKIKDALDFTKRHSPSVVDIVNRGVGKVNKALEGLEWNSNITKEAAAVAVSSGGTSTRVNTVQISLDGAIIGDEAGASRIGEIIGDNIIKKLQMNVRF